MTSTWQAPPPGSVHLQLAVDAPEHFALVPRLARWFDIIEVGTPVLKRFGLSAISTIKELAPGKAILADTKTADGGGLEATMVFEAGAHLMTVLAHASDPTIETTRTIATRWGGTVILDTILDGAFDPSEVIKASRDQVWLALHNSSDARLAGADSTAHSLVASRQAAGARTCLAGGIGRNNLHEVLKEPPDILVIGSSVTGADNPEEEAQWISNAVAARLG